MSAQDKLTRLTQWCKETTDVTLLFHYYQPLKSLCFIFLTFSAMQLILGIINNSDTEVKISRVNSLQIRPVETSHSCIMRQYFSNILKQSCTNVSFTEPYYIQQQKIQYNVLKICLCCYLLESGNRILNSQNQRILFAVLSLFDRYLHKFNKSLKCCEFNYCWQNTQRFWNKGLYNVLNAWD